MVFCTPNPADRYSQIVFIKKELGISNSVFNSGLLYMLDKTVKKNNNLFLQIAMRKTVIWSWRERNKKRAREMEEMLRSMKTMMIVQAINNDDIY